jgi:hypothetical protein
MSDYLDYEGNGPRDLQAEIDRLRGEIKESES